MRTVALDPSPNNQLGKSILAPAYEAGALADGFVFVHRHPPTKEKPFWSSTRCKRFISDAVTDMELDDPCHLRIPALPTATA